jgi:protein required for attachment to host cells
MTTWILIADAADARVFASDDEGRTLRRVVEVPDPVAWKKESDLGSDRPGRGNSRGLRGRTSTFALAPHGEAKDVAERRFAGHLAELLSEARHQGRYQGLVIAAPPRFLGMLRKSLDAVVNACLVGTIHKDLMRLGEADLPKALAGEMRGERA